MDWMEWDQPSGLIVIFAFIILLVLINQIFSTIKRGQATKAIRDAAAAGQPIDPEAIRALGADEDGEGDGFQAPVVLISVALGIIALGFVLGLAGGDTFTSVGDVTLVFAGAAAIPGFIGIGLLILAIARRSGRKRDE